MRAALGRRRHQDRCLIPGVSASTAVPAAAVLVLLVLALLSFLAPQLADDPFFHVSHRPAVTERRIRTPIVFTSSGDLTSNAVAGESFVVPNGGGNGSRDLWASKRSKYFFGCSNSSAKFSSAEAVRVPNRYLMIATSGGLNQQRTGITDAVVAARILNATLIVPKLDEKSFWKDASDFAEIFDVVWFIKSLSKDVKIVKQLPKNYGRYFATPYTMRVPRKCTPTCYQRHVLPILQKKYVVQLTKFDYRLANKLNTDFQKLRCRVNYHALRFTKPILEMGEKLIQRMRAKSKHFIALHLRFEPDMLAFSGCYYGGGDKERTELAAIRKRWKTLHTKNAEKERRHGRCPLTPEEVGLMLRALGFGHNVHIYVASGDVYGGGETLAPLKALFPNFHSKESLASVEELAPFSSFSSRMAALDFIVCDGSDVFVTNNNGNMARILAGRRRYFGHKRTIRPNTRKLYSLFLNRGNLTWEGFASKVQKYQKGFLGEPKEVRPGRGEFHENPSTCICEHPEAGQVLDPPKLDVKSDLGNSNRSFIDYGDEESDPDVDDAGDEFLRGSSNRTNVDDDPFINRSEELELEDIFSD